ncbi:MAG: ribonuclease HII [Dehalococcoidia bacterium]|jgi:ribonuclease HII
MARRPTFAYERPLWRQGLRLVAGVDEVGRGPLAGPVVAAAVVFPPRARFAWLAEVDDSKVLSAPKREQLAERIRAKALAVGVGSLSADQVDALGIAPAGRLAMARALAALAPAAEYALIDAFTLPEVVLPHRGIIDGDALSLSIAAASIVAKVARDRMMLAFDDLYPGYGFCRHKGYGTPEHLDALSRKGPCPIHRRSFAPVRDCLSAAEVAR